MQISKIELLIIAVLYPYTIPSTLCLGEKEIKRATTLTILLFLPGVIYSTCLVFKHYEEFRTKTMKK